MHFILRSYLFLLKKPYAAIFTTLVVAILCFMPSKELPELSGGDKMAHFLAFAALGFLWMKFNGLWLKNFIWLFFFAILIEIVQYLLPIEFHRSFDKYDILADTIGILIGFSIYIIEDWLSKKLLKLD
jgi:VanZ family protein